MLDMNSKNMKAKHPMTIVTDIAEAMQEVLTKRADELARETGFIKRQRKMTGSGFVQALVFGWLAEGEARLETLSQSCKNVSVTISRQGLHQRFTPEAARFLEAVLYESLSQVIRATPVETELLSRFKGVYVLDSTVINLPIELEDLWEGCQGSALKLSVCWDLLSGELIEVDLQDAREHDQKSMLQFRTVPANVLRLTDLGYFKLDVLQDIANKGGLWVTRYKLKTTLLDEHHKQLDLENLLLSSEGDTIDLPVYLGASHQIPCRLIAQRIPDEALKQRQEQLKRWESKQQKQASAMKWALLGWSIYVTNANPEQLSTEEVVLMIRVRWQIELLFKLWKDVIDIDDWRTEHVWRILCEVYAKFIACIIQHWLMISGGIHSLDKSMTQATSPIQNWAWALAYALNVTHLLVPFIEHIGQILATSCQIDFSTNSMPTHQRIKRSNA